MFEKYIVEFLGSILLIYIVLATGNPLAVGATFALVMLLIQSISGGYVNPVVTITMASAGKLPVNEVLPYCLAQILGGLVALEIYKRYKL
jgi:glycerol uptake facilitator-like aquaporin